MDNKLITLRNKAEQFNLSLTDKVLNRFGAFEEILKDYNSHTNLVSAKDINLIYEKHFVDSLSFGKFIKQDSNIKLIDIGSGGGFPIIPIAITAIHTTIITTFHGMFILKLSIFLSSRLNNQHFCSRIPFSIVFVCILCFKI